MKSKLLSAYFMELTISGVRCFRDGEAHTLSLAVRDRPARWTILLGDNGTGKTTLLQMLAYLRPVPSELDDKSAPEFEGGGAPEFSLDSATSEDSSYVRLDLMFTEGLSGTTAHMYAIDQHYLPIAAPNPSSLEGGGDLSATESYRSFVLGYGAHRRLRSSHIRVDSGSAHALVAGLFDSETPLVPAEEWFLQRDYAASKLLPGTPEHARAKRALDRVTNLLLSILPEVEALEAVIPNPASGGAQLMATTRYGRVRVSDLGLGYQATLAWVTDLAARMTAAYPDSSDPLGEPAVVLVDEIDLHLHPRWQRALLDSLSKQFPNVQWVVTAHSPLIVQNSPADSQIVVLRSEGNHVVIDNNPIHVRDWRLDQILTSDLFGLPSARPKRLDALIEERDRLLAQAELTPDDERRICELATELDALPVGELPVEIEAMRVIQEAARLTKDKS